MNSYNEFDRFYRPTSASEQPQAEVPVQPAPSSDTPETAPKRRKRRGARILAVLLVCALLVGGAFGAGYATREFLQSSRSNQTNLYVSNREPVEVSQVAVDGKTKMDYTELYAANVNSCVSINVSETTNIWGQQAQIAASSGSGFIINEDGYIVTNYHVISGTGNGTTTAQVTLYDGTTYDAEIIGGDSEFDIAVLKIDAPDLTPVVIGDSSALQVGDDIAVIGNPLGELTFSMSEGIVSTTNRLINVDGTPFNMIQITAAVNSGNSGGPLFNMYGEVVGIVSAKLSSSSSSEASVEGLGFAIPINDVKAMIEDIMTNGYITNKAYLGIYAGDFSPSMIPNSAFDSGVYLYSVEENGAAARAGLQAGDVITGLDGTEITDMDSLTAAKKNYSAGDTAVVEYYRNNEKYTTQLTFDAMPQASAEDTSSNSGTTTPNQNPNSGYYDPWEYFNRFFGTSSTNRDAA